MMQKILRLMIRSGFSLLATLALTSTLAFAQSYELGEGTFAGSGCPQGSAALTLSPDGSAVSILFDQFHGQIARGVFKGNVSCAIDIPVAVTPGYTIEATFVEYRGFVNLPVRGMFRLSTSGLATSRLAARFASVSTANGPITDNFYFRQKVLQGMPGMKKCPSSHSLMLNVRGEMIGRFSGKQEAEFALDSGDIGSDGVTIGISLRPCKQ